MQSYSACDDVYDSIVEQAVEEEIEVDGRNQCYASFHRLRCA